MKPIGKNVVARIKHLRASGHSYLEISRVCKVPKSTAWRHGKDVQILPEYHQRWVDRLFSPKVRSREHWELAKIKAKSLLNSLSDKELVLISSSLYWAEGAKRDFSFCNTDPAMVRVFVTILRKVFHVPNERIKISLRLYEDLNIQKCLKFWSGVTGISLGSHTSLDILKGTKNGKLEYGMCRVRVSKGGLLLKEITSVVERISDLA